MKKTDFFITYHHGDEMAARWIAAVLKQAQFSTLSDSWDFLPGEAPIEKIEYMFTAARNAMVLISRQFFQSMSEIESWQAVPTTMRLIKSFCGGPGPRGAGGLLESASLDSKPSLLLRAKSQELRAILVRIEACEIETVLGSKEYLDLAEIDAKEAEKRLLEAVGGVKADQKETETLPGSAGNREEILIKRKQEMDQLLDATIKHNYHMKLDLEQEVEKEIEVKNEITGEMDKRKEWVWEPVPLDTVLQDQKNYILMNPSGMGKTTFLTYVACALLDRNDNYRFLPLFFTCIGLNNRAGTIENFIRRQAESVYTSAQGSLMFEEWENLCVLIDALDQARDVDDILSSLLLHDKPLHYKKAKIILSSRQNTADKVTEGFARIRLKLPEAEEVQHYLGEENYKKLGGIIEASGELVKVPVLLEMLKTITEKGHVVSTLFNRADLYTEFTKVLLDQERSKPRFWQDRLAIHHFIDFELEQVLEKIAFFPLVDNEILEIPKEKLAQYCESPSKKEEMLNVGILLELFEDREQKIVFRHQSFQSYFAARYIYNHQPELFQEITSDITFFYNDVWYEVMRFFVGLENDPQKTEEIIDSIYLTEDKKVDLNQAMRLIFALFLMSESRVGKEFAQNVCKQLENLLKTNQHYWDFFNSNTDKFNKANDELRRFFITFLTPLLKDKEWNIRKSATEAFSKIFTPITSKDITRMETMGKFDDIFSQLTAGAFGKIVNNDHTTGIEKLFEIEDGDVNRTASEVFGKIVTFLMKDLPKDENVDVRCAAVEALGDSGTSKDIPHLEPLLRDKNKDVHEAAFEAIEKIYKRCTPVLCIDRVLLSNKEEKVFPTKIFSGQALHILHISDIHYAIEKDPTITCIFHEFLEDIKKWRTQQNHTKIHAICLTGDIAASGQKEQYDAINEKINVLLETTGCPQENLFIIPGNHDVQEYGHISSQGKTLLGQVRDNKINIDTDVLSSEEHYRLFHDKFANYYHFIAKYGYISSLPENSHPIPNLPKPWYNRKLKDFPVRFMGLNSALFCLQGFIKYGDIRMGTHQFHEAYFQCKGNGKGKAGDRRDPEVVILLTHHPLNWLTENEYGDYSTLLDRYAVLHLHGHIHKTHIEKKQRLFSSSGGYVSIGIGSLYGKKGKEDINTYHIITLYFEKQELHVWARRWNPDTGKWTVYDDDGNNRFRLPVKDRC